MRRDVWDNESSATSLGSSPTCCFMVIISMTVNQGFHGHVNCVPCSSVARRPRPLTLRRNRVKPNLRGSLVKLLGVHYNILLGKYPDFFFFFFLPETNTPMPWKSATVD